MKKAIAMLLATVMCTAMLTGCGSDSAANESSQASESSVAETAVATTEAAATTEAPKTSEKPKETSAPATTAKPTATPKATTASNSSGKTGSIHSKYVFCHKNGEWIKTDAYETCLRRLMSGVGYDVTNNHSFCMSLNSNVFIGKYGLPVTERARLLGHSVGTNLRYYSFAGKDSLDDICAILNGEIEVSPGSHQNIITFTIIKKSLYSITKCNLFLKGTI